MVPPKQQNFGPMIYKFAMAALWRVVVVNLCGGGCIVERVLHLAPALHLF